MKTKKRAAFWALFLVVFCISFGEHTAVAHSLDSATLTLKEVSAGRFAVHWQAASSALMQQSQPAVFPRPCLLASGELNCGRSGLAGTIEFPWLADSDTRVLVQIDWMSGARFMRLADRRRPTISVYSSTHHNAWQRVKPIVSDYTRLGVEHIFTGYDHLLFVLALTLLVRQGRRLFATITAFTIAHSVTLACAALGWLHLPAAVVEAEIALSIVLVCAECLRPPGSLTQQSPWLVSFLFGLLHGLGFASALLEIGLPKDHVPLALLFFNVGVELGQLIVIGLLLGLGYAAVRFIKRSLCCKRGLVYAMGTLAAFWSIERAVALFSQ